MVDFEKAVGLRSQGLTYEEIADHLQCSVAWCKKNLKDFKKPILLVEREKVDSTKQFAISILKDALARLEAL